MQPDAQRNAAATPTSTQFCSVEFPFDILSGICYLCWKTSSLRRRDPLVCYTFFYFFCFVYFPVIVPYKSYLRMWQRIYTRDPTFSFSRVSLRLILNTHQDRIKSINILSVIPNAAKGVFQAGTTDSFSRAHFMVGKPLQTTDSVPVCSHLITAFVVWSLKAVKWENPTAQHVIGV